MSLVFGIDPGPSVCGWALVGVEGNLSDQRSVQSYRFKIVDCGVSPTRNILDKSFTFPASSWAIERFEARGMPIGEDSVKTILVTGAMVARSDLGNVRMVRRSEVKSLFCGTQRATDANVRQAIIDIVGPVGTKKAPGPTYRVKSHAWPALAVAIASVCGCGMTADEYLLGGS